jgi:hypothetical protein
MIKAPNTKEIFYRISPANDGLVFAMADDAFRNHTIRTAMQVSKTWGEFRCAIGEGEYQAVLSAISTDISEPIIVPDDNDPFNSDRIPGYSDGDYPEWLQARMDALLPADILAKFSEKVATMFNGDYVSYRPVGRETYSFSSAETRLSRSSKRGPLFHLIDFCSSHPAGNRLVTSSNCNPSGYRPLRIASTMSGASGVSRNTRPT